MKRVFLLLSLFIWLPVQALELPDFTQLVEKVSPAVVNISTTSKPDKKAPRSELPEGIPFNDFFRRFFEDSPGFEFDGRNTTSLGSGFIISADGYVLTNHHVVKGADEIIVRMNDRSEYEAKLIGSDERSDTALLKIDTNKDLPFVKIGSSESLNVGEWVLAIGSPFGFDYSVTAGIVSAKGRSLPGSENNYVPFIQTDVAINPGNSGGPLFNLEGEVVGMNAQIYSRTGGFMGLSFTIPIDTVMNVEAQLRAEGKVSRGWLGVLIQDVDRQLAESFGMKKPQGALIAKILNNGPAKDAGFKVGDIILEFDGKLVDRSSDLPPIVGETPVNKPVKAHVLRQGKRTVVTVTLDELPSEEELKVAHNSTDDSSTSSKLGLSVESVPDALRKRLGLPKHGVRVSHVDADSAAKRAGIGTGDVILSINNQDVEDVKHFHEIAEGLENGRAVPVLVQRGKNPVFLALRVPDAE
jgi:serine protease Do